MLSLIPSIHATILSIVVAVVVVILPMVYQIILKVRDEIIEKCKTLNDIFTGCSFGGEFEDIYSNGSDNDFYEGFRERIKGICYLTHQNRTTIDFILKFNKEFTLLQMYSNRFLTRSPFLGSDEKFDEFLKSDMSRVYTIRSFFSETRWMLINNKHYIEEGLDRYFDKELPNLNQLALEMAKGNIPFHASLNEESIKQMGEVMGKRKNRIIETTAELIINDIVRMRESRNELKTYLDQLTRMFDYSLSEILPGLIEDKKKYHDLQSFFKSLPETKLIYTFIYSTLSFGVVLPLIINEFVSHFNLGGNLFFWIISLSFSLTFIPYYFALKKVFSLISNLKI